MEKLVGEVYPSAMPFYEALGWVPAGFTQDYSLAQLVVAFGEQAGMDMYREALEGTWMKEMLQ